MTRITLTAEQAQQIEEALEDIVRVFKFETGTPVEALAAIRAARAQDQAEQDPVAYLVTGPYEKHAFANISSAEVYCRGLNKGFGDTAYSVSLLYAAPVRTKDLTDDEIDEIFAEYGTIPNTKAVRAVIAKFKEKNK